MYKYQVRDSDEAQVRSLVSLGVSPIVSKVLAARGITKENAFKNKKSDLLPSAGMKGIHEASEIIAWSLMNRKKITIVGDYDCDGATATAIGLRGLKMTAVSLGMTPSEADENINFLVPNRFDYGYGLSPAIVDLVKSEQDPDLIITVDNGISSIEGVNRARDLGIKVVVTDHHLQGDSLPDADAIVNPNQDGCEFKSKNIAGCGVMFYVLNYLSGALRHNELFGDRPPPRLDTLYDLVALGTVADVVRLDDNNRILVNEGLKRIRDGLMSPGVRALFNVAGKDPSKALPADFGFGIGPRLNAAGRLSDMTIGIKCLTTENPIEAERLANQLNEMNITRRSIEESMKKEAEASIEDFQFNPTKAGFVISRDGWHHGVVGIIASRIKDRVYRPTIVFAPEEDAQFLRGSGRSIPGVHLRDVIDLATKRLKPGDVVKFGGHAMAAGLTIRAEAIDRFDDEFSKAILDLSDPSVMEEIVTTDGEIDVDYLSTDVVDEINQHIWGQGFPPPLFNGVFKVKDQQILKERHSKFLLEKDGKTFEALWWNNIQTAPPSLNIAYRLEKNSFKGRNTINIMVEKILTTDKPRIEQKPNIIGFGH